MGEEESFEEKPTGKPSIQTLLTELKNKGILGACVRLDGAIVASTIAMDSSSSSLISSISNIIDALMKENNDRYKEIEMTVDSIYLVIIPMEKHALCGILKDREDKKTLREYANRIAQFL